MRAATNTARKRLRVSEPGSPYGLPPAAYAARLTSDFVARTSADRRRELAQFFTPLELARFMAGMAHPATTTRRLLDPGAGTGVLACALCEHLPADIGSVHLDAYEVDGVLADLCRDALRHTQRWLEHRGVSFTYTVHHSDFVLENAAVLAGTKSLFAQRLPEPYDLAISNPPYFKLQKNDPRARAAAAVVHGQPNIYALFLAIMAGLLAEGGVMVTITPRSFTTGDYFRRFRQHLFRAVVPEAVHLFHSRKEAFRRDDVLQENVILCARRLSTRASRVVSVSTSAGVFDLGDRKVHRVPLASVIDLSARDIVFHIPTDTADDAVIEYVRAWPESLHRLGLEVSTGPVVAFRATRFLRLTNSEGTVPLLWLNHVHALRVVWPNRRSTKPQHIVAARESHPLLLPNATYVVLRRFTAKEERRRLTAAALFRGTVPGRMIGLENHLNYVYRPKGELAPDEAAGLAALLNSALLDRYFRVSNGNTQVNATELRSLPLPPRRALLALGAEIRRRAFEANEIDTVVAEVLRLPPALLEALGSNGHAEA